MVDLDIAGLRSKLDLENKYVDFSLIRATLTIEKTVGDLGIRLGEPTDDGECRGKCPKCGKDRAFALNVNTSRFNCFAKNCPLKGGGVIDFFAKLYQVPAKEAAHLLACAYGVQPYALATITAASGSNIKPAAGVSSDSSEVSQPSTEAAQGTAAAPPITAQHLIASIEHQLAQLKQLLTPR